MRDKRGIIHELEFMSESNGQASSTRARERERERKRERERERERKGRESARSGELKAEAGSRGESALSESAH
jgi:hypothetical protein